MTRLRTRLDRLEREIDVEARDEATGEPRVRVYIPDNGRGEVKSGGVITIYKIGEEDAG